MYVCIKPWDLVKDRMIISRSDGSATNRILGTRERHQRRFRWRLLFRELRVDIPRFGLKAVREGLESGVTVSSRGLHIQREGWFDLG